MYIYNVTVNLAAEIHEDWIAWMRDVHIPEVMECGCFVSSRMLKVLFVDDEGFTYSVQYRFEKMEDIERYQKQFAPELQRRHKERYGDSYTAFRTLLEEVQ
jgi:hypothetical protein